MSRFRVGSGYDSHRLAEGRRLVLCGLTIPHDRGLQGHSDADCPVHAVIDALLGALALGDIGKFFPDTDSAYKDADSMELLKIVLNNPAFSSWAISNLDITIIADKPKLAPYIESMREKLSGAMKLDLSCISIKAKTSEKLVPDAVQCHAAVLLEYIP